jgi:hypothetical protein
MGVGLVMLLRLVIYGATMKPRASYGCAYKVVLLDTRRYRGLLVMIHYGATPMCYLSVNLFCYLFLYCQKILVPNQDVSFVRIWNLDS